MTDTISSDLPGMREAARELTIQRGHASIHLPRIATYIEGAGALTPEVEGPVEPKDALNKHREAARALTDWRAQRDKELAELNAALAGQAPPPPEQVAMTEDQLQRAEAVLAEHNAQLEATRAAIAEAQAEPNDLRQLGVNATAGQIQANLILQQYAADFAQRFPGINTYHDLLKLTQDDPLLAQEVAEHLRTTQVQLEAIGAKCRELDLQRQHQFDTAYAPVRALESDAAMSLTNRTTLRCLVSLPFPEAVALEVPTRRCVIREPRFCHLTALGTRSLCGGRLDGDTS
jgi:hypothetical protein